MMSVFFLTGCRVSAVTGACVGHLETDGVEHYLHVTEKRNKKRRKILLDAARPVLAYVDASRHRGGQGGAALPADDAGRARLRCGGTWTARPPGGWSRNTARRPASTRRGWAAAASASTRLRKTAINDAIRNGATMHVGQPYCLLQQPCPGFFLARSADDTSARASFSTSLHLEQVAADLEIRRILSTAGKPRGRGKLERFFESLAQVCLGRLLTPIARVLTINNRLRVTPAVVEVARDSLVIGTA